MLEIIALIFLTRRIGALALRKGQKSGPWKLYTVLAWIGAEIVGVVLAVQLKGNLVFTLILGLAFAFGGFLIVNYKLKQLPDVQDEHWSDRIGQEEQ